MNHIWQGRWFLLHYSIKNVVHCKNCKEMTSSIEIETVTIVDFDELLTCSFSRSFSFFIFLSETRVKSDRSVLYYFTSLLITLELKILKQFLFSDGQLLSQFLVALENSICLVSRASWYSFIYLCFLTFILYGKILLTLICFETW